MQLSHLTISQAEKTPEECSRLSKKEVGQFMFKQKPLVIPYLSRILEQLICIFSSNMMGFQTLKHKIGPPEGSLGVHS